MTFQIEFYRIRDRDDAHAVVGRVTCEAIDRGAAISLARNLFDTLDMPQEPDLFRILDPEGRQIFCSDADASPQTETDPRQSA